MSVIDLISRQFSFSPSELIQYAQTCPYRYKTYLIDKRRSPEKRRISQPSKDLKIVQRFIIEAVLEPKLIIHQSAKAYRANTNIVDNARPHLQNRYLLKMDFIDFFPSIIASDFKEMLLRESIVKNDVEALILSLIFFKKEGHRLSLSIGSPGSPIISNSLLFEFDKKVSEMASNEGVSYTRYSDDLTFSTNHRKLLFSWPAKITNLLENINSPSLKVNEDKTVFSSSKYNRHVTGITIANDGTASLGRGKKRALRTRVYKARGLNEKELEKLRGYLAFSNQVEANLYSKLWKKYPDQMAFIFKKNA